MRVLEPAARIKEDNRLIVPNPALVPKVLEGSQRRSSLGTNKDPLAAPDEIGRFDHRFI
jgi:hypothetical protein